MDSTEVFFTIGNTMVFLSSFLLFKTVWKNRKKIKEYNLIGSLFTFLGMLLFCIGYLYMEFYISFILALPTTIFWLFVNVFNIKRLWKGR